MSGSASLIWSLIRVKLYSYTFQNTNSYFPSTHYICCYFYGAGLEFVFSWKIKGQRAEENSQVQFEDNLGTQMHDLKLSIRLTCCELLNCNTGTMNWIVDSDNLLANLTCSIWFMPCLMAALMLIFFTSQSF